MTFANRSFYSPESKQMLSQVEEEKKEEFGKVLIADADYFSALTLKTSFETLKLSCDITDSTTETLKLVKSRHDKEGSVYSMILLDS